jgi:hypothetical protein
MTHRVFRPLGMLHTVADQVDSLIPERARLYEPDSVRGTGRFVGAHSGGAVGGSAFLLVDRDSRVIVAICTNVDAGGAISRALNAANAEIPRLFDR